MDGAVFPPTTGETTKINQDTRHPSACSPCMYGIDVRLNVTGPNEARRTVVRPKRQGLAAKTKGTLSVYHMPFIHHSTPHTTASRLAIRWSVSRATYEGQVRSGPSFDVLQVKGTSEQVEEGGRPQQHGVAELEVGGVW